MDACVWNKLQKIMNNAYKKVPLYFNIKDNFNFCEDDINDISDWNKVPIISRDIIKYNSSAWISSEKVMDEINNNLLNFSNTEATGDCVHIYWDKCDLNKAISSYKFNRELCYGIYPSDKCCCFYNGHLIDEINDDGLLYIQKKSRLCFSTLNLDTANLKNLYDKMLAYNPKWLYIPSLVLRMLFKVKTEYNLPNFRRLKYIEVVGEDIIDNREKLLIQQEFNCTIINNFSINESYTIAYECSHGKLHIINESVFVEIVENNKICKDDEEGNICITSLNNTASPLIRCDIGIRGKIKQNYICECGKKTNILYDICNQKNAYIFNKYNEYLLPTSIAYTINCLNNKMDNCIKQFKIIQEECNLIKILLCVSSIIKDDIEYKKDIMAEFLELFDDYAYNEMNFSFLFVSYEEMFDFKFKNTYCILSP